MESFTFVTAERGCPVGVLGFIKRFSLTRHGTLQDVLPSVGLLWSKTKSNNQRTENERAPQNYLKTSVDDEDLLDRFLFLFRGLYDHGPEQEGSAEQRQHWPMS